MAIIVAAIITSVILRMEHQYKNINSSGRRMLRRLLILQNCCQRTLRRPEIRKISDRRTLRRWLFLIFPTAVRYAEGIFGNFRPAYVTPKGFLGISDRCTLRRIVLR
ncbi:MAG: hypothetical protein LBC98_08840 [Prevotellaceae bacterium]|nr:hypothetical protein [Prevotellaceae bacterium]